MAANILTISPLPAAYPGTPQLILDLRTCDACSISIQYTAHAAGVNGRAQVKFKRIMDYVEAGAIVSKDLGQEVEIDDATITGTFDLVSFVEYRSEVKSGGAAADTMALWDERPVKTTDRLEIYVYDSGDAVNPGDVVITYVAR